MGLSRPSLYNAFGDRRALPFTALDRYSEGHRALSTVLGDEPDRGASIESLLRSIAQDLSDPRETTGCLLVGATAACGVDDRELADALVEHRRSIEAALVARLERAKTDGQLVADADVPTLSAFFVGTIAAMADRARVDPDETALMGMVEWTMRAWPEP